MYVRITQMTRGMAIQILCIYCKLSDACVTKDGPHTIYHTNQVFCLKFKFTFSCLKQDVAHYSVKLLYLENEPCLLWCWYKFAERMNIA